MRKALAIAGRELRSIFLSPTAYVLIAVYLVLGGLMYHGLLLDFSRLSSQILAAAGDDARLLEAANLNQFVVRSHLWSLCLLLLLLTPFLTMRLLSEERRSGTAEMLLTSPVRTGDLVLGKYLAGLAAAGVLVLCSLHYVLFLYAVGQPEGRPIVVGFLGLFLAAAGFVAVGLFASSLSDNPAVAAVLALGILLALLLLEVWAPGAGPEYEGALRSLSATGPFRDFSKGVLSLSNVAYYVSLAALFLFGTARVLESQRWR